MAPEVLLLLIGVTLILVTLPSRKSMRRASGVGGGLAVLTLVALVHF